MHPRIVLKSMMTSHQLELWFQFTFHLFLREIYSKIAVIAVFWTYTGIFSSLSFLMAIYTIKNVCYPSDFKIIFIFLGSFQSHELNAFLCTPRGQDPFHAKKLYGIFTMPCLFHLPFHKVMWLSQNHGILWY